MISLRSCPAMLCITMLACIFLLSCSEKQVSEPPVISVTSPPAGSAYKAYDTILLTAEFSDDHKLNSVSISLNDRNNQPVMAPIFFDNPENPFSLNAYYPITNNAIESGTYELQFQATDGETVTNVFRKIEISALVKEFLSPLIVTQNTSILVTAYILDSTKSWKEITSLQGDYLGSQINSAFQQFYLSGRSFSALEAWDLNENKKAWRIPSVQLPHGRWFESISYQYPYLLVSYYEGYIKGIDRWGITDFTIDVPGQFYPGICRTLGNYIVVALYSRHSNDCSLGTFHFPGGHFRQLSGNVQPPVALFPLDGHSLLLFGNDNNKMVIQYYDIETGHLIPIKEISNDSIYDIASFGKNDFFISGKSGIYWYSYGQNSMVEFAGGINKAKLACENVDESLYTASGNVIRRFSVPEGVLIEEMLAPAGVVDIHLLYSK